jgi:hypothetical protein
MKQIEPLDFKKIDGQLTGLPLDEAIKQFAAILTDKVNEMVEEFNEL